MLCNSCNAQFLEEGARNAHYRSDWHRYNLKRKVAGLPGVTEEWFADRKAAAEAAASALAVASGADKDKSAVTRFECTVCCKEYGSRKAFDNHLNSRGHAARAALAPAGAATSDPIVKERKAPSPAPVPDAAAPSTAGKANGVANGAGGRRGKGGDILGKVRDVLTRGANDAREAQEMDEGSSEGEDESDEEEDQWEEVEDEEEAAALMEQGTEGREGEGGAESREEKGEAEVEGDMQVEEWDWDCSRCIFCERSFAGTGSGGESGSGSEGASGSVEECVSHMHRAHGFFLPDAEYISDLEGMLSYLALKVTKGCMCLLCDDRSKAFPSAAAARAHMEAKQHAKLRYGDGSGVAEEELEEFYDFSASYENEGKDMQLVLSGHDQEASSHLSLQRGGAELVIRGAPAGDGAEAATRVLGSREFARYYKQRPRPEDGKSSLLRAVVLRYKAMGLTTSGLRSYQDRKELARRDTAVKASQRAELFRTRVAFSNNVIRNLPKNCPY